MKILELKRKMNGKSHVARTKGIPESKRRIFDFYSEEYFNGMLELERRRAERSNQPFLLMLLDLKPLLPGRKRIAALAERIAEMLFNTFRKIDIKGWYSHGSIVGVIFTELKQIDDRTKGRILSKMGESLSALLRPDELNKVRISLHAFPKSDGKEQQEEHFFDPRLYPDIFHKTFVRRFSLALKRMVDVLGSLLAIVILLPLLSAIALAIKATSKGPVFFRQTRMGLGGKTFTLLKFRSMYIDSDERTHREYVTRFINGQKTGRHDSDPGHDGVFKIRNDPRITSVGRFLRHVSFDELPQFFNVLRGDMSLVGPRPPIPYEYDQYDVWHRGRVLEVKPGITGLWQVKGRSRIAFDEMVRLDLRYIRRWSLWLDLMILVRTPGSVLNGAY